MFDSQRPIQLCDIPSTPCTRVEKKFPESSRQRSPNDSIYYAGANKIDKLTTLFDGRAALKQQRIDSLNLSILTKFEIREEYYRQYVCECDGTCGTGQRGRGTECERKENKYLQS